jgi:DNA-directed RNA polymerase subunit M/transcription elongation factor TFIIS
MTAPERVTIQYAIAEKFQKYPKFTELSADDKASIARRIERSCFNVSIDIAVRCGVPREFTNQRYRDIYSAECMRILSNICTETAYDSYLADNILAGNIDVTKIAEMKNEELNPGASQSVRDEIELRQNQKTETKVSRRHTCKKCGCNETKPVEYQGRAVDEASSHSIKCVECGNVWRS